MKSLNKKRWNNGKRSERIMKNKMREAITKYINTKKLYKRTVRLLKLKMFSSGILEYSINNYGYIKSEIEILLNGIIENDEDYKYMYLLINSLYENIDSLLENLIIANHDTCLKIIRSISEQLIIFKCLMQNGKNLKENFYNWSIINDYINPKKEVELVSSVKELYKRYTLDIERYILSKKKNIATKKVNEYVKKLINNNYGWYYIKWTMDYDITLKYIAENEKCENIYKLFQHYSEKVHNNNTRTLMIQNKHNPSMEYHVIILLLYTQHHILDIIKEYVSKENYNCILAKIKENIQYNYDKMKYYEEKFDK